MNPSFDSGMIRYHFLQCSHTLDNRVLANLYCYRAHSFCSDHTIALDTIRHLGGASDGVNVSVSVLGSVELHRKISMNGWF